jgi:competence protein ComGC
MEITEDAILNLVVMIITLAIIGVALYLFVSYVNLQNDVTKLQKPTSPTSAPVK